MSAAELRQAAETLRERARTATPGPWEATWEECDGWWTITGAPHDGLVCPEVATDDARDGEDAAYIATMHPGVGLALADWLDTAGADLWAYGPLCECGSSCNACDDSLWEPHVRRALALARLINGGAS